MHPEIEIDIDNRFMRCAIEAAPTEQCWRCDGRGSEWTCSANGDVYAEDVCGLCWGTGQVRECANTKCANARKPGDDHGTCGRWQCHEIVEEVAWEVAIDERDERRFEEWRDAKL